MVGCQLDNRCHGKRVYNHEANRVNRRDEPIRMFSFMIGMDHPAFQRVIRCRLVLENSVVKTYFPFLKPMIAITWLTAQSHDS